MDKESFINLAVEYLVSNAYKHVDDADYSLGMEKMQSTELRELAGELYDELYNSNGTIKL